ncbi:hypothetical protein ACFSHT_20720 [Paraburkholderia silviterrae]|uniref:Uncharacterized protein n=1 Tax=Paraburkholderia silviterrae TaxID=2528715 RepID=A0A4R5M4F3_9BURK|nr:hypothetical protein [Paraburkholderia silviterrae]TDG20702.1 hypothetical protein EYW47_24475 [Paraburkholderia silviterrae]
MSNGDPVDQAAEDTRALAMDYFGIGDSEAETLMKLAKRCAQTAGIPLAGTGGIALAGVGSITVPLVGSVPGYLVGALAGFVGGTTACMIARGSTAEHVRQILSENSLTEEQFKSGVLALLSTAHGKAGYVSKI